MIYKFTNSNNTSVFVIGDDGVCKKSIIVTGIDPANSDYQEFLRWCEAGNEPLPPDSQE
jgi:hypothetical protein